MLVDAIIEVFEKHGINQEVVNDEMAQAVASDLEPKIIEILQKNDKMSFWSTEAKELLKEAEEELVGMKAKYVDAVKTSANSFDGPPKFNQAQEAMKLKITEISNLIFKIQELLIKN